MCSARTERDAPFGRDVDFVSDVRLAREAEHITSLCAVGAIHHYADRLTSLRRSRNFTFSDSEVFRNFVDAFRVCRQIRTGKTLEIFAKLWYNRKKDVLTWPKSKF